MSEWISAKDRLPENDGKYIITQDYYRIDDPKHQKKPLRRTVEVAEYDIERGWRRAPNYDVIAWLSFPEPYERE